MNRFYRVIFNLAVGAWQVVSELVSTPRGQMRGGTGDAEIGTVPPLRFAVWCALGMVTLALPLMAQESQERILVDRAAPGDQRPMVVEAPSGAPLIQITTPSAAGVSRNRYSQFDVGSQGAILNNSRAGADTVLGGPVRGNRFLATGTAKVILNEVNGPASQLNGFVEVAGDRAAVVIANPAGIQTSGAGFINASRVTLTTGTPVFNGGSLDGYRVGNGAIRVDGSGLDSSKADYTDLISRSMELNGKVWAQELQATLGANTVSADHTQITAHAGDGAAPQFALDASALGGMYGNKIVLRGTESGVGVRSAGAIGAQAGELIVTIDGRLENTGKLQAQTNNRIDARDGVVNAGTLSAGREAVITTGASLDNSGGSLNAQRVEVNAAALVNRGGTMGQTGVQGLALSAHSVSNRDGGRIGLAEPNTAGGGSTGGGATSGGGTVGGGDSGGSTGSGSPGGEVMRPQPEVLADGALNIAGSLNNDGGKINAGGGVQLNTAAGIDNSGGHLGLGRLAIDQGHFLNNRGELMVTGDARIHAERMGNDAGRFEVGGALDIDATAISNRAGLISHSGTTNARVHAGTLDNTDGALATNAHTLELGGDVVVNERGRIEHAGAGGLKLDAGTLRGADGVIVTNGAAAMTVRQADHRGATLSTMQLRLTAGDFDNRGGSIVATGADANTLTTTGTLDNGAGGTISSNGDLILGVANLGNAGGTVQQAGTGTLVIDATALEGAAGRIASNGALSITGSTTNLRDGTTVARRVVIDTGLLTTAGGTLKASGNHALTITARNGLDNTAGTIATNSVLRLTAGSVNNTNGALQAAGTGATDLRIAGTFDNTDGQLVQRGADGTLALDVSGALVNANGLIGAEGTGSVHAGSIDNSAGTVFGQRNLTLASDGDLRSVTGQLQSSGDLTVSAGGILDNTDGVINATGHSALTAARIDNVRGQMLARSATDDPALTMGATAINNQGGVIGTRAGDAVLNVADIDNRKGGRLVADRDLTLNSSTVDNSGGTAFANRNLGYENGAGRLTNARGQFGAGEHARLTLANINSASNGLIQAGKVWLNTPNLDLGSNGSVVGNDVHAQLATLTGDGSLYGKQWLDADFSGDYTYGTGPKLESDVLLDLAVAGAFTNVGTLQTPGELALSATSIINQGAINASNADGGGSAHITAGSIENRRGASIEGDRLELSANVFNNTGDIVGDSVKVTADVLTNGQDQGTALAAVNYGEGFIGSSRQLDLRANHVANRDGDIFSAGSLSIGGRDAARAAEVANISGRIQAEGGARISAQTIRNEHRMLAVETYTLPADEAYALGTQKKFDEVHAHLSAAELQALDRMGRDQPSGLGPADETAMFQKLGWVQVADIGALEGVGPELKQKLNATYNQRAIDQGHGFGEYVGAIHGDLKQDDVYVTGQRLDATRTSAGSQILTGGDLTLDTGGAVRNYASRIAAGGNLTIAGAAFDAKSPDPRVENIAFAGQYEGTRTTNAWTREGSEGHFQKTNGSWVTNPLVQESTSVTHATTFAGPSLADATITAGGGVSIDAGDVTTTAVRAGTGLGALNGGSLEGAGGVIVPGNSKVAPQVIGAAERPLAGLVAEDNGLFDVHADPNAKFLVTTAPRFAKGGPWNGSDHLLDALRTDPNSVHKRLGDGYYEQRLVMEQILQLTGRRSLSGDGNANAQYRALMDNAAATASRLGLQLGEPLTSAQIAALDNDIVWLVEQQVNGQTVLVPVVYLSKATAKRMSSDGALIDGDTLSIRSSGTVRNDGTLAATKGAFLSADTLINDGRINGGGFTGITTRGDTVNRGRIEGNAVATDAGGSVVNTATFDGLAAKAGVIQAGTGGLQIDAKVDVINQGQMASAGHAVVTAGRDFVQNAATNQRGGVTIKAPAGSLTTGGSAVVTTGRDVVLDQSTITTGQHAVIDAGRDAKFTASTVHAGGSIAVTAGRDIVADTVTDTRTTVGVENKEKGKQKTTTVTTTTEETVRGSKFQAGGDIAMVADNDITLTAATVRSDNGGIALAAGNDLTLNTAQENHSVVTDSVSKKKDTLSKSTTTTHSEVADSYAIGTTLSGERVDLSAGNNMLLKGALIAGDKGVTAVAGNDITIETGVNTHTESSRTDKKTSGAFSSGGAGFTIGSRKTGDTLELTQTTHSGTLIGSSEGRADIVAGNNVSITGSDVLSNAGTLISGKNVTTQHAEDTLDVTQTQYAKQSGLNVSVKGGAAQVATTLYDTGKRAGEVEDDRLKGLYAAKGAQTLFSEAAGGGTDGIDQIKDLQNFDPTMNPDGTMSGTAGMSLRVGIGASSSQSGVTTHETSARGSNIRSNGDVAIVAREGNLTVTGSHVEGENVGLAAKRDILLQSAKETTEQRERSKASSGEIGVTVGSEAGIGVYVSASAARGKGEGASSRHAETVIQGNQSVSFVSGGNTTLEGAQMIGERVIGSVGGDFTVRSQQDTDTYKRKDESAGVDAAVGTGGGSVSVNYAQSKIDSNYTSVREQSGIQAGSDGFQIDVKGHTQLDGGAIASTATPDKNIFSTGSLGFTDLKNEAEYKATSVSASVSGGSSGGSGSGGYANTGDKASSITNAGIADGRLILKDGSGTGIARGTTELQQDGLKEIYDAQKVAATMEMQQVAGQVGFTTVGDLSSTMKEKAQRDLDAAKQSGNQADIDAAQARVTSWSEGGTNKTILHAITGAGVAALGGGNAIDGLTAAGVAQVALPHMIDALKANGVDPTSAEGKMLLLAASAAIGGAVGGDTGAGAALAATSNNYLTHAQLEEHEQRLASCGSDQACRQKEIDRAENLSAIQDQELWDACTGASKNPGLCGIHVEAAQKYVANESVERLGLQRDRDKSNEWLAKFYDTAEGEAYRGNFWGGTGKGIIDSGSKMLTGLLGMIGYIGELAFVPGAAANPETGQLEYNPLIKPTPIFGADPTAGPVGQGGYKFGDALGTAFSAVYGTKGASAKVDEVLAGARHEAIASVDDIAASTGISREALRTDLAAQAGIPRTLEQVWGSSTDDLVRAYEMDGATLTAKPPAQGMSGRGEVYTVEGHPFINEIEFHPGGASHGDGIYYKFTYKDGTQVRVIDPNSGFKPGTITRDQQYFDPQGNRLRYEGRKWIPWQ